MVLFLTLMVILHSSVSDNASIQVSFIGFSSQILSVERKNKFLGLY